jgi:hypothetical protein
MTFLQPLLLWGLPLALLPVLIHLFNRLRHRSLPWAAMMFLRSATRKSTRYARLRQLLILLFRVLALAALVVAVSRPLAGGWAGWLVSAAPDVILVLFDRSASMESRVGEFSRRQQAVQLVAQAARQFEDTSRLVLVESAGRAPQEIAGPAALPELALAAPTDTAADVPAMLQSALDWLVQNQPGSVELWVASDLQRSNWQPDSDRWPALAAGFGKLPQGVRVRLLALNDEPPANASVQVLDARRRPLGDRSELELTLDLQRTAGGPATFPLTLNLDGAVSQIEVKMDGPSLRHRQKAPLGSKAGGGWGYVELPADAHLRDNRSYFVYGAPAALRSAVVAADAQVGRILQLAAAPDPRNTNQMCELLTPGAPDKVNWDALSLVLWQGPLPQREPAARLQAFVEAGGVVVFLPSGEAGSFDGPGWGEAHTAAAEKTFRVTRWEQQDGPLARTEEGLVLPLADLTVLKRQAVLGERHFLATFEDGAPLLTRRATGQGQLLFCATLPAKEWSSLADGPVLVPLVQRLLEAGGRRFTLAGSVACGEWAPDEGERWTCVDSTTPKDPLTQAGVFRTGGRLAAVNRPAREDDREVLEPVKAKALLGDLPVQLFEEKLSGAPRLQSELWRVFLFLMAACLLLEGLLILPEKPGKAGRQNGAADALDAAENIVGAAKG